jgi:hypothetical protein
VGHLAQCGDRVWCQDVETYASDIFVRGWSAGVLQPDPAHRADIPPATPVRRDLLPGQCTMVFELRDTTVASRRCCSPQAYATRLSASVVFLVKIISSQSA